MAEIYFVNLFDILARRRGILTYNTFTLNWPRINICTCCDQLSYRSSVSLCSKCSYSKCSKDIVDCCVTGVNSVDNKEWICKTCDRSFKRDELPGFSNANK